MKKTQALLKDGTEQLNRECGNSSKFEAKIRRTKANYMSKKNGIVTFVITIMIINLVNT